MLPRKHRADAVTIGYEVCGSKTETRAPPMESHATPSFQEFPLPRAKEAVTTHPAQSATPVLVLRRVRPWQRTRPHHVQFAQEIRRVIPAGVLCPPWGPSRDCQLHTSLRHLLRRGSGGPVTPRAGRARRDSSSCQRGQRGGLEPPRDGIRWQGGRATHPQSCGPRVQLPVLGSQV